MKKEIIFNDHCWFCFKPIKVKKSDPDNMRIPIALQPIRRVISITIQMPIHRKCINIIMKSIYRERKVAQYEYYKKNTLPVNEQTLKKFRKNPIILRGHK